MLTASYDGTAKIWNAGVGLCLQTLSGHTGFVTSAVYSLDWGSVLTASDDKTAKIWNDGSKMTGGECIQTLSGTANYAVFSQDGWAVLTPSDYTARIWIASTGECAQKLSGHTGLLTSAVFA